MSRRKILFIINPKSGGKSKASVHNLIEGTIDRDRFDFSVTETLYASHACELTREAVRAGFDAVIAVGGDGTVNEVARELIGTDTALGILPCGSGNGLARHLGIPMNIKKAIEFINNAEAISIDYGKINGTPFFCTCGMGFDAKVSKSFAEGHQRGLIGYITQTLHEYIAYKPDTYEIEDESGAIMSKAFVIACGNAAQYGNNFYITPHASMKDGLLTVTILKPFLAVDIPVIVSQIINNRIDRNSHIKTFSCRQLKIRRSKPGAVHFDGEPYDMGTEIAVEIVPDGLFVLGRPDWDGSYEPMPIHKRLIEIVGA